LLEGYKRGRESKEIGEESWVGDTAGTLLDWGVEWSTRAATEFISSSIHHVGYQKLRPLWHSRYSAQGIEGLLKSEFGQTCLANVQKPLFITATELSQDGSYTLHFFDSIRAQMDDQYNIPLWQVLRATSAAPTFFPPANITIGGQAKIFVDGGVLANNPTYHGFVLLDDYLKQNYADIKYNVVSLSTGQYYNTRAHDHSYGSIGWVDGIIDATMQGQSDSTHSIMKRLLKQDYYRLNIKTLTEEVASMDNVSDDNIQKLKQIALEVVGTGDQKEEFNCILSFLVSSNIQHKPNRYH